MDTISDTQWQQYQRDGYLHLGRMLDGGQLKAMQDRIDAIMLGEAPVDYKRMLMQLDSETGDYENAGEMSRGHKGRTLGYRKIQDLEYDPIFLAFMQRPIFRDLCARVHGPQTPIDCFRAMFMNKPANKGTFLPWHQDRWKQFDRDPQITIWLALDPATVENGCVQLIPGSHHALINPDHHSGFLTKEQVAHWCTDDKRIFLELEPGEAALLHNWTLHGSDVNRSSQSRRAFSVCYMDANTVDEKGERYSRIFGPGALSVEQLKASAAAVA